MIKIPVFTVLLQVLLTSCNRTITTTEQLATLAGIQRTACGQDSTHLVLFVNRQVADTELRKKVLNFYHSRGYSPAWIGAGGISENAGNLINMLYAEGAYSFQKNAGSANELQQLYQKVSGDRTERIHCEDSLALQLEVLLTKSFLEFAQRNWGGVGNEVLKKVNWYITRKQLNYDRLLDDYLHTSKDMLMEEPVYRQYELLKAYLNKYNAIARNRTWPSLYPGKAALKRGDTAAAVIGIKQLLLQTGDLSATDSLPIFDTLLENAVKLFQRRHGLVADGVVSKRTRQAMSVPPLERVRQILVNMERCRWVPVQISGDYLVVNIPEFRLHAYRNKHWTWSCKVIVGQSNPLHHTVIFNDSLEFIVFNPYWNIPKNILRKEILPAIRKDKGYIQKNNLEVTDRNGHMVDPASIRWRGYADNLPYMIRQRPGEDNALGKIKFLFPNPYDIYMHDTPAKSLFNESDRDFSHGCIRLEQPLGLVEFLLSGDSSWTSERITAVLNSGRETFVKLKKKTPIFIAYFTCWVDGFGKLNFRNDIYGHDARMEQLLFVN